MNSLFCFLKDYSNDFWIINLVSNMKTSLAMYRRHKVTNKKEHQKKRWTKTMDNILILSLANIAKSGMKVDKSFKYQAFLEATNSMNRKFPIMCMDVGNVEKKACEY